MKCRVKRARGSSFFNFCGTVDDWLDFLILMGTQLFSAHNFDVLAKNSSKMKSFSALKILSESPTLVTIFRDFNLFRCATIVGQ